MKDQKIVERLVDILFRCLHDLSLKEVMIAVPVDVQKNILQEDRYMDFLCPQLSSHPRHIDIYHQKVMGD